MRKRVLLLHGWGGSDYPHWQAWIASEIAKNYGTVSFPLLKNPHFPTKNSWLKELDAHLKNFQPEVVICHSLANTLWFHYARENKIEGVEHLLLVAPPSNSCNIETLKTFFPCELPSSLQAKNITLVTSNSDPYMSEEEAQKLAQKYALEHIVLEDAGHINADSGHGEWDFVKKYIEEIDYDFKH